MTNLEIEKLLKNVDNKFTLVVEAAKRARQINEYMSKSRKEIPAEETPPLVKKDSENPLTLALAEIAEGKVTVLRPPELKETKKKPVRKKPPKEKKS